MWLYILLGCLFSRMTGNMHFCTKSKKDFPHVTLVFEDGKWVEAHKMILAASSCLCLAENSKKNIRIHWSLWEEFRAISNTVGTFDFWRTLSLHLIQILCAILYAFSSFWSGVRCALTYDNQVVVFGFATDAQKIEPQQRAQFAFLPKNCLNAIF